MKNTLLHQAAKFKLQNRKHKRWQKAVSILACIVVFCTVYALILPALTAEGTPHCGIEEHTHTDECYENRLICGKEEGEGAHTHTDECYTQEQTLICGLEEGEGAHTHTEECYDEDGNLICGLEENEGHQHTEECYQTENILTCDQEESAGHQHTAECYERVLTCGKEEHTHTLACYSDPNADVEDADTWQNSVSSVSLTGNWGNDLAAIAQTQIGYRESTSNYNVAEDGATMNGYTRYGAWAGDPYRDNWSAQFTDFCLSYAGIPTSAMVQPSDCWEWAPVSKEGYTPNTGDLIILDGNQDGTPDHAGIVLSANDTQVTTVIGDSDKEVKQNTYNLDNAIIVGYVTMPRNPNFDYGDAEPAADDADAPEPDNNNIEETPTAEETPEPAQAAEEDEDDAPEALDDETSSMAATGEDGDAVNQRIKVELSSSEPESITGNTLSAKVVSTYSQANNPDSKATVYVKVGKLPEGVGILGFKNGKHTVTYNGGQNKLELELVQENGEYYIKYEQPAGSTIEFDVQLSSTNGTMPAETKVTLSVDKDRTKAPDGTTGKDYLDDSQDLIWRAKNEWDPVSKKVNKQDQAYTKVSGTNLTGTYEYTIEANQSNGENYGEIWTAYMTVTDIFTLPNNVSFPEGVKAENGKIVTSDGKTILEFTDLQKGTVENLNIDGKTVTYTVKIPNQHLKNNVPTQEQDNLNIKMKLYADKLQVPADYKDREDSEIQKDIIRNHVKIAPHPYKEYPVKETEDDALIIPSREPEKIVVGKKADNTSVKNGVKAGDTITYTLSVKNEGTNEIIVKDSKGNYYKVTDTLPQYLELTDAQIADLKSKNITVTKNNGIYTLEWIPSESNIASGETKEVSFTVKVKDADDPAMKDLSNNSDISNQAQYKNQYTENVKVKYHKGYTTVKKESNANGVLNNGAEVIYKITVENPTDIPVANETLKDVLPNGLEFISAQFNSTEITKSQKNISLSDGHKVDFDVNGQNLQWTVDKIGAHEQLTFTYKCRVNTDKTGGNTVLKNNVTTGSGGSGNADITVKNPIVINKTVDKDTSKVYSDGQEFNYTITLKNDESNPNNVKDQYLTDELPTGMILGDSIPLIKKVNGRESTVSWIDFYENKNGSVREGNATFTAKFGDRTAGVTFESNRIVLRWLIDELKSGEKVTIQYPAKIILSDEQKKNGGSYSFINTVKYLDRSKSVTVYGGSEKGKLYLQKTFNGYSPYNSEKEYQKKYGNIIFKLTGKTSSGEPIQFEDGTYEKEVKYSDFSCPSWDNSRWGYTFDNLPVGEYTLVETNADVEGKERTTTYKAKVVKAKDATDIDGEKSVTSSENASFEVVDSASTGKAIRVTVDNKYEVPKSVDLQKSVWGIYDKKDTSSLQNNGIASKEVFSKDGTKVVAYTITVINTGETSVDISNIQDEIPTGLTYKGLTNERSFVWTYPYTDALTNEIVAKHTDQMYIERSDYNNFASNVHVKADINGQNLSMTVTRDDGKPYKLDQGKYFIFSVICETNNQMVSDIPMTNTAKLIVDKDVNYKDHEEIKTIGTSVDANQNNGSSKDEGIQNDKRVISSEVTITPINQIIPGIEKKAVGYIKAGDSKLNNINTNDNISPQSAVKWLVTLYNDGVLDMSNYKVTDIVTDPFHLITRDEAQKLHKGVIQEAYKYTVYYANGQKEYEEDITDAVWNSINDRELNKFEFNFADPKYVIPAGGYATLELYTENEAHTNYQIYTNTATLIPTQEFNANGVKSGHGELVKNDDGEYIGVKASAAVNALGEYGTVSWKTITEEGNSSNTASGSDDRNYITVEKDVDVIYRNHIRNVSNNKMNNLVMIDLLPGLNDTGVVNQEDIRGSEFTVAFAKNLNIYKLDKNNQSIPVSGYTVKYSSETSFTEDEFKGQLGAEWHDTWLASDKSFVVVLNGEIDPGDTLVYEYKGKLGSDAAPGLIAWNSFGYRYQVVGKTKGIIAEPPKVGVKIPASSPIIRKEVVDSNGKVQEADETKKFQFKLKDGATELATFEVSQGGYKNFKDITDLVGKPIALENGKTYTIEEVDIPEGYELLGIGEDGKKLRPSSYSFVYYEKQNIIILAKNKITDNGYELPETGGIGTNRFTAVGLALMAGSLMCGYVMRRKRRERRGI